MNKISMISVWIGLLLRFSAEHKHWFMRSPDGATRPEL